MMTDAGLDRERAIWNAFAEEKLEALTETPTPFFDDHMASREEYKLYAGFLRDNSDKEGLVLQLGAADPYGIILPDVGYRNIIISDLAPRALDWAKLRFEKSGKNANVTYLEADAHHLPLQNNSIGLIIMGGVLHHLKRPEAIMEFRRVLKPGGKLVCLEYYLNGPIRLGLVQRKVRGIDRGTDDPLRQADLNFIRRHFSNTSFRYYGFTSVLLSKLNPFRPDARKDLDAYLRYKNRLVRVDLFLGRIIPGYARYTSSTVVIMAEK